MSYPSRRQSTWCVTWCDPILNQCSYMVATDLQTIIQVCFAVACNSCQKGWFTGIFWACKSHAENIQCYCKQAKTCKPSKLTANSKIISMTICVWILLWQGTMGPVFVAFKIGCDWQMVLEWCLQRCLQHRSFLTKWRSFSGGFF